MQQTFLSHTKAIRIHQTEPQSREKYPAILLLHGAGGNTTFWPNHLGPLAASLGAALYVPSYFDRTETQHADPALILDGIHVPLWLETVADALSHVRSRPNVDPDRIALLGISLGAFLALAHAATQPGIRAVVEISGGLVEPYASRASANFPPTLILHGEQDPVVPITHAQSLAARLQELNVPHHSLFISGEGHWFSPSAQLRILDAVSTFLAQTL